MASIERMGFGNVRSDNFVCFDCDEAVPPSHIYGVLDKKIAEMFCQSCAERICVEIGQDYVSSTSYQKARAKKQEALATTKASVSTVGVQAASDVNSIT